jgi:hypothetical protein
VITRTGSAGGLFGVGDQLREVLLRLALATAHRLGGVPLHARDGVDPRDDS